MWEYIYFSNLMDMNIWIEKNSAKYRYEVIFVEDGYGIEYKPLKKIIWGD